MKEHITPVRVFILALFFLYGWYIADTVRDTNREIKRIEKETQCDFVEMNKMLGSIAYFSCDNKIVLKKVN